MDFVPGLRGLLRRLTLIPPQNMETPPITRALYGWLGFGMAGLFNPKLASAMPAGEAEGMLALPGTVLVFDHLYNRLCQISLGEHRDLRSGRDENKFETQGMTALPVEGFSCPMVGEAPLSLACRVTDIVKLGTHDMFLADIVSVYVDDALMNEDGKLNLAKAGLCAYAHGEYFALGKKIGSFGFSVKKKKRAPRKGGR